MISSENIFFCTKKTTALTSIFDVILICQILQKWKQIGKMKSKIVWKNHLEFLKYFLCQEMNKIINSWKHSSNGKKWFKTNDYVLRWHYSQVNIYTYGQAPLCLGWNIVLLSSGRTGNDHHWCVFKNLLLMLSWLLTKFSG